MNKNNSDCYPIAYACYNKDLKIRLKSTSGGVFTVLAEFVISSLQGVVCGAAFDEDLMVRHICVENVNDLSKLRGSKYPQSHIGNMYSIIEDFLRSGRSVLFIGTPCQVSGLLKLLGDKPDNLICMDFVCHGVASNKLWQDYLENFEDKKNIKKFTFKDKYKGWKKWYIKINYNKRVKYERGSMNIFMRSYLKYFNIRPSCYQCNFKGIKRDSDFTIADCWGKVEENKRLNDNNGMSALLIQNGRALDIFEKIKEQLEYEKYGAIEMMEGNWTTFNSVPLPVKRSEFYEHYLSNDVSTTLIKYFKPSLKSNLAYKFKCLIGKER